MLRTIKIQHAPKRHAPPDHYFHFIQIGHVQRLRRFKTTTALGLGKGKNKDRAKSFSFSECRCSFLKRRMPLNMLSMNEMNQVVWIGAPRGRVLLINAVDLFCVFGYFTFAKRSPLRFVSLRSQR